MTVMAFDPDRTRNAAVIVDCVELGYLDEDDLVLDPTYGKGKFWTLWRPHRYVFSDLDPAKSPWAGPVDVRRMPWDNERFDAVVLDLPYKFNGTPSDTDGADERYGVHVKATRAERMMLYYDALNECDRVLRPKGNMLVKCQDQVCGGKVRWMSDDITNYMLNIGYEKVDELYVKSYRAQPRDEQEHARRNYSTMLVFKK